MASAAETPYVGPRPFERSAEDRARFFGRDREAQEIVSLIVSHPLVLVYAQSGAGKTSLFNTAVWEELEGLNVALLPLARVRGAAPDLTADEIANLYVFSALQSIDQETDPHELAGLSLTDFLPDYLRRKGVGELQTRTLVFDQFEELFTSELVYELYGDGWQKQQEDFFAQVAQAIADDPMLRVVFLIRKEYLAELERFAPRLPERLRTRFHLEPLDGDEALAAVEGPLLGTHRSFDEGVARALVDRLLAMRVGPEHDVRGRFVEPVQMQVVCRSLWEGLPANATTITEADVRAFGDVATVLGRFYDEAVRAAASAAHTPERRLRAKLEDDFITSIGTRGTVYLTRDWQRRSAALDELERRHVVHAEWRAGTRWYELTHDRLIDPIRTSNARLRSRVMRMRATAASIVAVAAALVVATVVVTDGSRDTGSMSQAVRDRIVAGALAGVKYEPSIHYSQGSSRMAWLGTVRIPDMPGTIGAMDTSSFVTWCYWQAGAPNPNFDGPYNRAAGGYTGTLLAHMRHIPRSEVRPGDLVVWTPPKDGVHVAVVVSGGKDMTLVSHGSDSGPVLLRFRDEDAYQRRHGHGHVIWLTPP